MRVLLVALTILIGCGSNRLVDAPNGQCNEPCYEGSQSQAGVGACSYGTWRCDDLYTYEPVCVGWGEPSDEICDGIDNDCDGYIDRIWLDCSTSCGPGTAFCRNGTYESCTAKQPTQEVCNGIDDDCDGIVDNKDKLPIEPCYSLGLNSDTLKYGPCSPGIFTCSMGTKRCYKEILPSVEICDGIDNNCNGQVDEGVVNTTIQYDIIGCFDTSGSMSGTLNSCAAASDTWVTKYGLDQTYEFAVCTAPDDDVNNGSTVVLRTNLGNASKFSQVVNSLKDTGSGAEPTIDAIWMVLDPANPLGISWRPGSKHILILFSDEEPQSYVTPFISYVDLAQRVSMSSTLVVVFTSTTYMSAWSSVLQPPNGKVLDIALSDQDMITELDKVISSITCK